MQNFLEGSFHNPPQPTGILGDLHPSKAIFKSRDSRWTALMNPYSSVSPSMNAVSASTSPRHQAPLIGGEDFRIFDFASF